MSLNCHSYKTNIIYICMYYKEIDYISVVLCPTLGADTQPQSHIGCEHAAIVFCVME